MSDIVEQLLTMADGSDFFSPGTCRNAAAEIARLRADLEHLRASELSWKLIAKHEIRWNDTPQTEKEATLQKALSEEVALGIEKEDEITRLRAELEHERSVVADLNNENFTLAAGLCREQYCDDHGNSRCRFEDEIRLLRMQLESLSEIMLDNQAEIVSLRAQKDVLLAALKRAVRKLEANGMQDWPVTRIARAAIKSAEDLENERTGCVQGWT